MPGMGQVYVGFYRRGFTYMGIVALTITILESGIRGLEPLFGFSLSFFWIYNVIDAYRLAKLYNRAGELGQELDLQDVAKLPPMGGSLFGGIVLMAVGLLLLLHLKFDVSMAWIEEWWPVLPIVLGAYLVMKAIRSRQGGNP
jgi:predicted ABC-type sugar transport system permease subunit